MSGWYRTYEVEGGVYVFAEGEPVGRFLPRPDERMKGQRRA